MNRSIICTWFQPNPVYWNFPTTYVFGLSSSKTWYVAGLITWDEISAAILDVLRDYHKANMWVKGPISKLQATHESIDQVSSNILPKSQLHTDLVRVKTPNFRKRVRDGEIIMNPYENVKVRIDYQSTPVIRSSSFVKRHTVLLDFLSSSHYGTGDDRLYGATKLRIGPNRYVAIPRIPADYYKVEWEEGAHPLENGWTRQQTEYVVNQATRGVNLDPALIQETLAEANTDALDLLTAVAEMPETVRSIADLLVSVGNFCKDAKKRELYLSASFKKRDERLLKRLSQIDEQSRSGRHTAKQLKQLASERRELSWQLKRSAEELADAIADVYMNWRYNIMPNKALIEDVVAFSENFTREYLRTRSFDRPNVDDILPDYKGWTKAHDLTVEHRVLIKRGFSLGSDAWRQLLMHVQTNAGLTAFELMTRSFVIDWFLTIGDMLSSLTFTETWDQQKSCVSIKTNGTVTYTNTTNGSKVHFVFDGYVRTPIDPYGYVGIYFRPDINLLRALDSVCMLWPSAKNAIRSFK